MVLCRILALKKSILICNMRQITGPNGVVAILDKLAKTLETTIANGFNAVASERRRCGSICTQLASVAGNAIKAAEANVVRAKQSVSATKNAEQASVAAFEKAKVKLEDAIKAKRITESNINREIRLIRVLERKIDQLASGGKRVCATFPTLPLTSQRPRRLQLLRRSSLSLS